MSDSKTQTAKTEIPTKKLIKTAHRPKTHLHRRGRDTDRDGMDLPPFLYHSEC